MRIIYFIFHATIASWMIFMSSLLIFRFPKGRVGDAVGRRRLRYLLALCPSYVLMVYFVAYRIVGRFYAVPLMSEHLDAYVNYLIFPLALVGFVLSATMFGADVWTALKSKYARRGQK